MTTETETVAKVLAEMQRMAKRWVVASSDEMETFATRIAAAHAREAKDAARYRWLREKTSMLVNRHGELCLAHFRKCDGDKSLTDAAIDAAMPRVEVEG